MARQANTLFLEEWLRSSTGSGDRRSGTVASRPPASSARAIIQAWAELRDSLQNQSFNTRHLQALKTLLNSQATLHVADPQAKLLVSILSSQNLALPCESYPLFLRLLYVWIRKSFRPSLVLVDSAVEVLSQVFTSKLGSNSSPSLLAEGVLLLGAFACRPLLSEASKNVCLELLCGLLEGEYRLIGSEEGLVSEILAGIGYALSSSLDVYSARCLDALLGIWGKEGGPAGTVSHGLMILHLVEWLISSFIKSQSFAKIQVFVEEALETSKPSYVPFAIVMTAAGVLRAFNRFISGGQGLDNIFKLRFSAENQIKSIAQCLIANIKGVYYWGKSPADSLLLQCLSVALARCGPISFSNPLFICLGSTLSTEVFPLRHIYKVVLESHNGIVPGLGLNMVKEHLNSIPFKEAGAITGVFCNQYASADEDNRRIVEKIIWDFCQDLYLKHRQVALLVRGVEDELLGDMEKIAESAFLMVVLFALAVTKHRLNSKYSQELQMETSVQILISFSCVEYFRRMRLPEYMDTIRAVIANVQKNESAFVSFIESIPSYDDLTNQQGSSFMPKMENIWSKDEVQTARMLFYLRVIPTCIEHLPAPLFRRVVAPIMFLYMGHPNRKVARASHSLFVAFVSSEKISDGNERRLLKEQLVFYYMQRSLEGYPGITPFEGMASGVAALIRHLPAGSPAIFFCVNSLVEKATKLCTEVFTQETDVWKNWQGESEPCKKIIELLLRLISLVDIQVLPNLLKLLAQLVVQLPKDGQKLVLNELHSQVSESEDVIRKPTLVSWLQTLSYFCSQSMIGSAISKGITHQESSCAASTTDALSLNRLNARL